MKDGRFWESSVCDFLAAQGLVELERNWRTSFGEIDLIMQDGSTLVFVEVKYRSNPVHGHPFEAVSKKKQQTIRRTAQCYLLTCRARHLSLRFDVVALCDGRLEWLKGAF